MNALVGIALSPMKAEMLSVDGLDGMESWNLGLMRRRIRGFAPAGSTILVWSTSK